MRRSHSYWRGPCNGSGKAGGTPRLRRPHHILGDIIMMAVGVNRVRGFMARVRRGKPAGEGRSRERPPTPRGCLGFPPAYRSARLPQRDGVGKGAARFPSRPRSVWCQLTEGSCRRRWARNRSRGMVVCVSRRTGLQMHLPASSSEGLEARPPVLDRGWGAGAGAPYTHVRRE